MVCVGIVGARTRNSVADKEVIEAAVMGLIDKYDEVTLVSGGCPKGADRFAEEIAKAWGLSIVVHRPDLSGVRCRGEAAARYYARNCLIAHDADILIACVAPARCGGTEMTLQQFRTSKGSQNCIIV